MSCTSSCHHNFWTPNTTLKAFISKDSHASVYGPSPQPRKIPTFHGYIYSFYIYHQWWNFHGFVSLEEWNIQTKNEKKTRSDRCAPCIAKSLKLWRCSNREWSLGLTGSWTKNPLKIGWWPQQACLPSISFRSSPWKWIVTRLLSVCANFEKVRC